MLSNKGIDYLVEAKEAKQRLATYEKQIKDKESQVKSKRDRLTSLQSNQKHDINKNISSRRRNIEDVFDKNIDSIEKDIRSEENRRAKSKMAQMGKRIAEVNEQLILTNNQLDEHLNTLSKKYKVSIKSNSKMYFTFLVPKGIRECAIAGGVIFALTTVFLLLIHFFAPADLKVLFYIGFALIYSIFYIMKTNYTSKNMKYLEESRSIYDRISANERIMDLNANKIRNEKSEEAYDLVEFDERINELKQKFDNQVNEKKEKLNEFDQFTAKTIEEEIIKKYEDDIDKATTDVNNSVAELDELKSEKERHASYVMTNFDNQLGDGFKEIKKIDELLKIMNENVRVNTVEEAIDAYYQE